MLGVSTTDAGGFFNLAWTTTTTAPTSARIRIRGDHKDNIFLIRTASGDVLNLVSDPAVALTAGTTAANPQQLNNIVWGNAAAPIAELNVYDGAWRAWDVFKQSAVLVSRFKNVVVKTNSADCPTSCANGVTNTISLDLNAPYAPQARVMHEMGHIASYQASRGLKLNSTRQHYCFPDLSGDGCGWALNGAEWSSAAFEEGLATFLGDTALYSADAVAPHTCLAVATSCGVNFNVEATPICAGDVNRHPLTVDRYLWDAFDLNVDYANEQMARSFADFIDGVSAFPDGDGERQKDEPFSGTQLDELDGRSAVDFRENWKSRGIYSDVQWGGNCGPLGD